MTDKKDEAAEVAQKIDSLRKLAAEGELGDDSLEDVAGGGDHTDGVIHTDGVVHTNVPS